MSVARPPRRRLRNFFRHRAGDQFAFAVVWLLLGMAKLMIHRVPFERLAARLGTSRGAEPFVPLTSPRQEARARRISSLVRWVAGHTPWVSDCFPQALVASRLLQLFGIPWLLCFGLQRGPDRALAAHAWVVSGRVSVTGGYSFDRLTVVACYTSIESPGPRAVS